MSNEVACYYATHQRPEPPDHMAAVFMASTFVFAVADVEYCHLLGHAEKYQAAGMQYVLAEEDLSSWSTTPEDIDRFVARTLKVTELLRQSTRVSVTSPKGPDARFKLRPGRKVWNFAARTAERREALIVPNSMAFGGPAYATTTLPVLLRSTAFGANDMGLAATISMLMVMILIAMSFLYLRYYTRAEEQLRY